MTGRPEDEANETPEADAERLLGHPGRVADLGWHCRCDGGRAVPVGAIQSVVVCDRCDLQRLKSAK